jgi:hypothetical protein
MRERSKIKTDGLIKTKREKQRKRKGMPGKLTDFDGGFPWYTTM